NLWEMAIVRLRIGNNVRQSGLKDRSGDALVPGDRCSQWDRLFANRVIKHQLLFVVIGQQNRAILGVHYIQRDRECLLKQVLQLDLLRKDLGHSSDGTDFDLSTAQESAEILLRRQMVRLNAGRICDIVLCHGGPLLVRQPVLLSASCLTSVHQRASSLPNDYYTLSQSGCSFLAQ